MTGRVHVHVAIWPLLGLATASLASGCGASDTATAGSTTTLAAARSAQSQVYLVRAGSMEPTLPIGTRVILKRGLPPAVGAIVVVHPPEGSAEEECGPNRHTVKAGGSACDTPFPGKAQVKLIERIVADPGDDIYIRAGYVYRKALGSETFIRERGLYTRPCAPHPDCNFLRPIEIPPAHWFLMGDNRGESNDSRFWGPVPTAWIVGTVTQVHKPAF